MASTMADSSGIPIVDFSPYRLSLDRPDSHQFQKLVDDVHNALTTIGFFFIVNNDFPQEKVEEMFQVSKTFFDLPVDIKMKYPHEFDIPRKKEHGYSPLQGESLNPDQQCGDLKESFHISPSTRTYDNDTLWPTESECPGIKTTMLNFFDLCLPMHNRVLEVMGHGLKLEDPLFFLNYYTEHMLDSWSVLRTLYYPPLTEFPLKKGQLRCSEHTDYGGITMLFPQKPGLEVCRRDGTYIKVPLVEGGILINIGHLMQRWTSDTYIAAKHRVLMDDTPEERAQCRQSIAFFGNPRPDALVECINNSNKYPPITSQEYLIQRLNAAY